ncbi:M16 family metallopeptidase [Sphingomonas sp. 22176]|uniref:M16 family metallopeptidase n=1 Tax=Sphingomonas sp. 22176 TaxID=3453884 RepID=UPI003F87B2AE
MNEVECVAMSEAAAGVGAVRNWRLGKEKLLSMITMDWSRHVLPNGLTVILQPAAATALVHVSIAYRVGSMDEGPRQTGLAHFFEHLMFGGTRTLPGSYVTRMIDAGAIDVNAVTMRDMTRYVQTIPAYMLEHVLFAEADRMGDFAASLDTGIVERERKVVLEEKRQIEAQPLGKLHDWLSRGLTPPGHPYHHPTIGYEHDIANYTLDDILAWHGEHYGPSNAVIVVAGAIDPDRTLAMVEMYFGAIPPRNPPRRILAHVPSMPQQSIMRVADRIGDPGIYLQGWNTPSYVGTPRAHLALTMAAELFANGQASPLHRRLVAQDGLAAGVSATALAGRGTGMFVIRARLKAAADLRVQRAVDDAVKAFLEMPIDAERLEEVRLQRLSRTARDMVDLQRRATLLVEGEVFHGDASWYREEAGVIADLDGAEIRETAAHWLAREGFRLSVDQISTRTSGATAPKSVPAIGDAAAMPVCPPAWSTTRLRCGARLLVSQRPSDTTFHLRALGHGGRSRERPGMEGLAELAASVPMIGAGPDDAAGLSGRIARAGLSVSMAAGMQVGVANVSGLAIALPAGVALMSDMLIRPNFESPDCRRRAEAIAGSASAQAGMPNERFNTILYRALFGSDHRICAPLPATPSPSKALWGDEVRAFHRGGWRADKVDLLLAGDIAIADAETLFNAMFDDWQMGDEHLPPPRLTLEDATAGIRIVDAPEREAARLVMGWRPEAQGGEAYLMVRCLHDSLCGGFASRANRRLREEKAWTYGVGGQAGELVPGIGPLFASVSTEIAPELAGETVGELRRLVAELRSDSPITENEVEAFRRSERQRLAGLNEKAADAVDAMQFMLQHGYLGTADWQTYRTNVDRLSCDTIQARIGTLLPAPTEIVCVVMGNAAAIRASLERAGFDSAIVE